MSKQDASNEHRARNEAKHEAKGIDIMKTAIWTIGGLCAAAAGILVLSRRNQPVTELAHRLEEAWVDHHTVV